LNFKGQTALHIVSKRECAEPARILLRAGIDFNIQDKYGKKAADYLRTTGPNLFYKMKSESRLPANKE
jgi:ankyrin repeat protein